jgi:phosphatidylethanolamine/phosphatidyl-N-methylethanolamine N-methyltransferase
MSELLHKFQRISCRECRYCSLMSSLIVLKTGEVGVVGCHLEERSSLVEETPQEHCAIAEYEHFLGEFFRRPLNVGALAPSSAQLAVTMLKPIDFDRMGAIAELGAGTGSFTKHILRRKRNQTKFVALETNPTFCEYLIRRWGSSWFVNRSAEELRETLNARKIAHVGAVVSGLPWASLRHDLQVNILRQVLLSLAPGGVFVTFAYLQGLMLPGGIRFRRLLREQFASVERTGVVWSNLPPAFVYVCRKHKGLS